MDDYNDELERAFRAAKEECLAFIEKHNDALPLNCDVCGGQWVPGLPCVACGTRAKVAWAVLLDTETGYSAVSLTNRRFSYSRHDVAV